MDIKEKVLLIEDDPGIVKFIKATLSANNYDVLAAKTGTAALALASSKLFGLIPGIVGDVLSKIPFLDVGIPAIMSVYFDWFSGIMQAFIFCMLTVMYIANAAEE